MIKNFSALLVFSAFFLQLFFPAALAFAEDAATTTVAEPSAAAASTTAEASPPAAGQIVSSSTPEDVSASSTPGDSTSTPPAMTASTTPPIESHSTTTPATTTLESAETNTVPTSSISSTTASTTATATGEPAIISGDAVAMANILNLVNTNFINSNGIILFSNFFDYLKNNLDLRNGSLFDGRCATDSCSGDNASFNLSNNAFIDNLLSIYATSGGNSIANGATSTISTGDAFAGLNLINIANTNFVDSEYLLVTLNAFKGVDGDIVFPSLSNFFDSLKQSSGSVVLDNRAAVNNNVNVGADSGQNAIEGSGTIANGSSTASSNVFNQINTDLVGGANVSILFRVYGNWVGDVFGAPDNLKWIQTPNGIYLFDTATGSGGSIGEVNATGTNKAFINNNVSVIALTGKNAISNSGSGSISTGNAVAGANIVNIANSNIIGRNWIMAIINIFGDFHGNIAFGRPDLWVGEQISAPAEIHQGDTLDYKLTVINNGDSPATQVRLSDDNINNFDIISSSVPYTKDEHGMVWNIGSLPAGKAAEITYRAKVLLDKEMDIANSIKALARETDNNLTDNTDTASVHIKAKSVVRPGSHRRSGSSLGSSGGKVLGVNTFATSSTVSIQRADPMSVLKDRNQPVHQKLVVYNPYDYPIESATLRDTLRSPNGKIIHTEVWNFGDIQPHEEIVVAYDLEFNSTAANGFYNLSSSLLSSQNEHGTGINGLILLGNFKPAQTQAPKKISKAATAVAIVNKEVAREEVVEPAKPTVSEEPATGPIMNSLKKNPSRLSPLRAVFSAVPIVLGKIFSAVKSSL